MDTYLACTCRCGSCFKYLEPQPASLVKHGIIGCRKMLENAPGFVVQSYVVPNEVDLRKDGDEYANRAVWKIITNRMSVDLSAGKHRSEFRRLNHARLTEMRGPAKLVHVQKHRLCHGLEDV